MGCDQEGRIAGVGELGGGGGFRCYRSDVTLTRGGRCRIKGGFDGNPTGEAEPRDRLCTDWLRSFSAAPGGAGECSLGASLYYFVGISDLVRLRLVLLAGTCRVEGSVFKKTRNKH